MIRLLLVVTFLVARARGEAEGRPETKPEPSKNTVPQPTRVELGTQNAEGDEEVKRDRAALLRSSKTFPFVVDPFLRPFAGLPGPIGVSLGVGLPAPPPLPVEIGPPRYPIHPPSGRPVLVTGQRPECAINENYCLYNQHYPLDKVNAIIDRYYNDVRHIYTDLYQFPPHDIVYYDNRTLNYRHGGHFICESSVQYLRPGWAQNLYGEWVAVINTDKFPQSVRIETCRYKDKRCEYLPPCYKSRCVQRYNYVKLLSLDPYRPTYKPIVDVFQIPSACSCFVEDFTYY